MTLRIANAAGFWGDSLDAPRRLVEGTRVDYLTLEYLAELTLSILARQREKDPQRGYATDFIDGLASLLPELTAQPELRIVTNAGGMNPRACARAVAGLLSDTPLADERIAVVDGDDLLSRLADLRAAGCTLENIDTGEPLATVADRVVSANAYLGARPIFEALQAGARLVITGRVADASLVVGPAVHYYGWDWQDWDRLAGATVAGHVIECGAQATGGFYSHWDELDLAHVGYPIAEVDEDGVATITKADGTGGVVNRETVTEQLVYEIGDPSAYVTPDVVADFTTVELAELAADRVALRGATGRAAPDNYKVSLAYRDGFTATGQLLVYGSDPVGKAHACADLVTARVRAAGFELEKVHVECLGAGDGVPGLHAPPRDLREVVLRLSVRDSRREAVERFTREIAPLVTSGPAGLAGYAAPRGNVREVFSYWPTLIRQDLVQPRVEVRRAPDWL